MTKLSKIPDITEGNQKKKNIMKLKRNESMTSAEK